MKKSNLVSLAVLILWASIAWTKPNKYMPDLIPMYDARAPKLLTHDGSPDYWALNPFYIPQVPAHCGTFSMMMVVNAFHKSIDAEFDNWFDKDVEKIITKDQVSHGGHTLDQIGKVLQVKLGKGYRVEVIRPEPNNVGKEKWLAALHANDKSADDFIIVNFLQNKVNDTPEDVNNDVGHISPVAAYNAGKKMVLIMDVDREYFVPYWAPAEKVFHAMVDFKDKETGKTRGYVHVTKL